MTHYAETSYGFEYGAAKIERTMPDDKFGVVITISTPRELVDIRVTPTGFIRVGTVAKQGQHASGR